MNTPNPINVTFDIGDGRMVTIETGKLARQADGAVTVRLGDCVILATVVANREPREGQSFFPLSVDYQEKFASAGRIPGSFFKREARLNDYEVLTSRLIDRALRPLFPDDYLCDVQVLVSLVSYGVGLKTWSNELLILYPRLVRTVKPFKKSNST